jgi:ribosomal protein S6--L-glutamate ligase
MKKIVVLSTNKELYSTKRLVEAIRQRGYEALVVNHTKCSLMMEKGNPMIYYNGEPITNVSAVIPRIGASVTMYGTAVVRQFELMKVFVAVESQAIVRSRDKLRSLQIMAREHLGVPKTVFARHPKNQDVEILLKQIGSLPVIIKLLEGTQGLGVVLTETRKAAKSVIEAFSGLKTSILIQEFIKEAGGSDIRVFIVDGEVVGSMKRTGAEGDFRSNIHRGGTAEVIKLTAKEEKAALKAAKSMGLSIAGVDLLQSSRGPLILEVNSSPGLQGIERATGVDIAGKIVEYIEASIETDSKPKKKKKIVV